MAVAQRAEAPLTSLAREPASWARQGTERLSAAMKIVSDLTARELSLGIGVVQEFVSSRPAAPLIEMGGRAVAGIVGAEKILLDLTADETRLAVDGLKEGLRLRPAAAAIVDLVPKAVATYVAMGKSFLEDTDQQNQELVESYAEGKPLMIADRVKKFAWQRVECFVENEKKYLDEINEQVTIATENSEDAPKATRTRYQVFIHVARESVDKFIDAERKILQLAIAQLKAPKPHAKTRSRTSFAELTQESVHNITAAQKALLDLATKPMNGAAEEAPKARKTPRRAAKRKK